MDRASWLRICLLRLHLWWTVARTGSTTGLLMLTFVRIWMTILTACWLRDVWDNLHASRNNTSGTTTASGVCRCGRSSEALGELLHQSNSDVVSRNVDRIRNAEDDKGSFGGERKTGIGRIQARTRCFLDLTNAHSRLADDRSDENVRDKQTERIGLGLSCRRCFERFVVESPDDETKSLLILAGHRHNTRATYLGDRILLTADGQDSLDGASCIIANGALGIGETTDHGHVFSALANAGCSFRT